MLEQFRLEADNITMDSMSASDESIILGDLNVKSPQWGSPVANKIGEYWCESLAALNWLFTTRKILQHL
nr:unnamed protein product [Callosobruchus chinensis]